VAPKCPCQFRHRDGLRDEIAHAGAQALLPGSRERVRAHADDRDACTVALRLARADPLRRLDAVHDRHLAVHQHHVDATGDESLERLAAVRGELDVGGELKVTSSSGRGSTFAFMVRVASAANLDQALRHRMQRLQQAPREHQEGEQHEDDARHQCRPEERARGAKGPGVHGPRAQQLDLGAEPRAQVPC